jgi:membrane associated rhomboid family serine protease
MIPLRDVIPSRTAPVITVLLIAANAAAFFYEQSLPEAGYRELLVTWGLVPASFGPLALVTSMFLHGGWLHFLGNMLYLWIFGDNVEDRFGHVRFLCFYLLCGAVAAILQTLADRASQVPMIGASGAIAGVLGAYLVMFPRSRVLTLVPIFVFVQIVEVPAILLLGIWFLFQLAAGLGSLSAPGGQSLGGVAFWAHAGGFMAGVLMVAVFRRPERLRVEWWDV